MSEHYRIGIDIGGTFTDGVLISEETGEISIQKVPSTPSDPSRGFMAAVEGFAAEAGLKPERLRYVIHATTVATNALLERRGASAALLVTRGFRDVLEIARQVRHELYDLQTEKPAPLIPRDRCIEVPERLDHAGAVLEPLDEAAVVEQIVPRLRELEVEAVAVCLLHAYRNPAHEQRVGELLRAALPELSISLSSDVAPEIREYWRASTTATNAYVAPVVSRYLERVEEGLDRAGTAAPLHVVQSSGGIMTAATAKRTPVQMLESGPASGVSAAAFVAGLAGFPDAISFDMGGTTAKAGLIRGGRPMVLPEFEAGGHAGTGAGIARGSGFPILGAVMDLVEVSAGGGSIAWIDGGGLLRVGPRSAGADPGPACYGRGGRLPTVTDANVVLGRLNPDYFLGGRMALDREAAHAAIAEHCAEPLGMEVVDAASGIVAIANAAMVQSMRLVSIARGYDPRDFALVAFGGAGPVHANELAAELGMRTMIVPPSPGVASAFGMLVTDLRQDYRATVMAPLADADLGELSRTFERFEALGRERLAEEGFDREAIGLTRYAELRYSGQSWRLTVDLPGGTLDGDALAQVRERFDAQHRQLYGYAVPEEPIEIVNVGVLATGVIPKPPMRGQEQVGATVEDGRRGSRQVFFAGHGFLDADVYDRYALPLGARIAGPAVVEEMDSSSVVSPGYTGEVADHGMLVLHAETR